MEATTSPDLRETLNSFQKNGVFGTNRRELAEKATFGELDFCEEDTGSKAL
jgi:hypothetical protein